MEDNVNKILSTFQSKVKCITENSIGTNIEFENGENIQLTGEKVKLTQEIICSFCSTLKKPLFTVDEFSYICKDCTSLALKTFIENGIPIDLELEVKENE
jgi:thioredoxin-related protein